MKNTIKILSIAWLSIGAFLAATSTTQAGVITQTFDYAEMKTTDWTKNLNIAKWVGGTLNSVTIKETVDWWAYLAGANSSPDTPTTVGSVQADLQLYDTTKGAPTSYHTNHVWESLVGYSGPATNINPNTSIIFGDYYLTNTIIYSSILDTLDPSQFSGSGFVPWFVSTYTPETESTTGGIWNKTKDAKANLDVMVIYNYDGGGIYVPPVSVPEPSAGILLGVGGLICWGWRRKVARKA